MDNTNKTSIRGSTKYSTPKQTTGNQKIHPKIQDNRKGNSKCPTRVLASSVMSEKPTKPIPYRVCSQTPQVISPRNNPSTSASTQSGPGTVRYPATRTSWKSVTKAPDPSKRNHGHSINIHACKQPSLCQCQLYVSSKSSREIVVE